MSNLNLLSATMVELTPLAKGVFGEAQIHEMKKKGLKLSLIHI